MVKHPLVTTSWDDGCPVDLELAKLLKKYGLKGTFYVPVSNSEREVMDEKSLRILSKDFEIGAHTLSHKDLMKISLKDAKEEILEGKKQLEGILNKKVQMFCYPKGHYNKQIIDLVKEAGFIGARTTECFRIEVPKNPYRMWTTIHVHPSPARKILGNCIQNRNLRGLYHVIKNLGKSWSELANHYFNYVYMHGGVFHLWGHSWEIEEFGLWDGLDEFLSFLSNQNQVKYMSNGEVIRYILKKE